MNEGFQVRLRRYGRTWPIDKFSADGILLKNDLDVFPRTISVDFDARNEATRHRMDRIRQLKGWQGKRFELRVTLRDGILSFVGDDEHSLPGGAYWFRVEIADLETPPGRLKLDIEDNQSDARVDVDVDVAVDSRAIAVTAFDEFDPLIRNVLQAPESSLDGQPIEQWLASDDARPTRKACLLNLMAKLRTAPDATAPLIADVRSIFFAGTDCVCGQVTSKLLTRLQALANEPEKPFYSERDPASATHRKLRNVMEAHKWGTSRDYTAHSFFQRGRKGIRVAIAAPSVGSAGFCAAFDIDPGNRLQDLVGFVVHMGELAADTDHLTLRNALAKGETKDYLYYTLAKEPAGAREGHLTGVDVVPSAATPPGEPAAKPTETGSVDIEQILATMSHASRSDSDAARMASSPGVEPVDAAVFCPPRVARKSVFMVQVFLYPPGAEAAVEGQAVRADSTSEHRGVYSLPLDVPRGTRVDLHLEAPTLTVAEPHASIVWRGRPTPTQFEVGVPAVVKGQNAIARIRFAIEGVPAGTLRFQVALAAAGTSAERAGPRELRAIRYRRAFVSYASPDRPEVLRRVQAFKIAGMSVFQDILDLDPGERWERALYREIDACDVFLLFWSRAAASSVWVAKEIDYALARKGGDEDRAPDIQPVPIEGPPVVPPPERLKGLHFNDALLTQISAATPSGPGSPAGSG